MNTFPIVGSFVGRAQNKKDTSASAEVSEEDGS